MAAPGKQPKAMSSRLADMKFMRRSSGAPATPSTPAGPPAKKQRLSNGTGIRSAATPIGTPQSEKFEQSQENDEEGFHKSETQWYLSYKPPQVAIAESPLRIVSAGFSSLDAVESNDARSKSDDEDEETSRPQIHGRKSFGKFNKKLEKQQNGDTAPESDSESDADDDDEDEGEDGEIEDDPTGVKALIAQGRKEATDRVRAERKAKRKADAAGMNELAAERRKKEVNLNHVTSISGGGQSRPQDHSKTTCHGCGGKGHIAKDCPEKRSKKPRRSY